MRRSRPDNLWWTISGDAAVWFLPAGVTVLVGIVAWVLFGQVKDEEELWIGGVVAVGFILIGLWRCLVVWRMTRHGVWTTARPVGRGATYRGRLTDIEFEYTFQGRTFQEKVPMLLSDASELPAEGVTVIVDPKKPTRIIVVDDFDLQDDEGRQNRR